MNNSQSNTDSKNNLKRQNSHDYYKQKPRILTIQYGNVRGPNLRNRGGNANNKHLIRNTNKSSPFYDSNINPNSKSARPRSGWYGSLGSLTAILLSNMDVNSSASHICGRYDKGIHDMIKSDLVLSGNNGDGEIWSGDQDGSCTHTPVSESKRFPSNSTNN